MKLLRLDLHAFGPFSDHVLDLDAGNEGLHIICGPNEAGKSSAMRALQQLLYGIPQRSTDNFKHPHKDMRVGALFRRSNGEMVECIRRKGNRNTLRGPDDDAVLNERILAEIMGGLDQDAFLQRFSIDHNELVRGGRAIAEGGGDLSQTLFAASSGIANLGSVRRALSEEAARLFKPSSRSTIPRINECLIAFKAKRDEIKQFSLPSAEWKKHDKALSDAKKKQEELRHAILEAEAQSQRLARISEAIPLISRFEELADELRRLSDVPSLPENFGDERRESISKLKHAQLACNEARGELEYINAKIEQFEVPELLLAHANSIHQLRERLGSHRKAALDKPGLEAELQALQVDARDLLKELGKPQLPLEQADDIRLGAADRLRIQELSALQQTLAAEEQTAAEILEDMQRRLARIRQTLTDAGLERDAEPLRRAVRSVELAGDLDEDVQHAATRLEELETRVDIELKALPLWSGPLVQLEQLAVPSAETSERFQDRIESVVRKLEELNGRTIEEKHEIEKLDERIQELSLAEDVPSEEDLAAARVLRERGWKLVRRAWLQGQIDAAEVDAFVAGFSQAGDLATAYEQSVGHADGTVDRLRSEAERVGEQAQLLAQQAKHTSRLQRLHEQAQAAQTDLDWQQQEWIKQWAAARIEPLPPREMIGWLRRQQDLIDRANELRDADRAHRRLLQKERECCVLLQRDLQQFAGIEGGEVAGSQKLLLVRARTLLAEADAISEERRQLERERGQIDQQLPDAERRANEARSALADWQQQWNAAIGNLGMRPGATAREAAAMVQFNADLFSKLKAVNKLRDRLDGIETDAAVFNTSVQKLTEMIAPDLQDIAVETAIEELHDRLTRAQTSQARLAELLDQREKHQQKFQEAERTIGAMQTRLAELCAQAGCDTHDQLAEVEQQALRHLEVQRVYREIQDRLLQNCAGVPLDEFISSARQYNPDELLPKIGQLQSEIDELTRQSAQFSEAIGHERGELSRMDGSARAAEAEEDSQELLAEIRTHVESYVRLRLAAAVLRDGIESYRERNQGPLLQRASELFEQLTLGRFDGLRADYNDKGDAVLVGTRPLGRSTVGVDGLSDGTCDQLYLALRLAGLEAYLADNEPIPFVVDDILIRCDDDRSMAVLKALAQVSERTQVILFTHHEHLSNLAQDVLDADTLFCHELDCFRKTGSQKTSPPIRSI